MQTLHTRQYILAGLFAALTAIGAFLRIPAPPASFTLQFFFTCMAGLLLGPKFGALSQGVYVLLGLIGLPIFTQGGGFSYIFEPTFGFLLGLIPAAWVTGWLAGGKSSSFWRLVLACSAGTGVLYLVGLPYLHGILTLYLHRDWSIRQTVVGSMLLFLPWDAVKILCAAALGKKILPILAHTNRQS